MIGLAAKSLDEVEAAAEEKTRNRERRKFWVELLEAAGPKIPRFANISPGTTPDLGAGSGVRGVPFKFVATRSYGRVELYIDRGEKQENKEIFDELQSQRSAIEATFKGPLSWERLDDKRASRIKAEMLGDPFDDTQRESLMTFMVDAMVRFESALKEPLARIQARLRARSAAEEEGRE
nr:DUF4268 domain-containing protein [Bradyrhizobium sp. IC3195]